MKVLFAASECVPFIKTGGLADVVGALPKEILKAGEDVHVYRPFEHMIPRKRDFYKGEKPVVIKTKRTDMAGEWMIWYFYAKAERLKMVRAGMNEETAYMEIYE